MNTRNHTALLLVALVVFCSFLNAQSSAVVPRLVNFSGNAKDALGKPIAGTIGATLSIYKDESGGVWGQSPGWSFYSAGHASQDRASGGWVKALLFVNTAQAPYTIQRCYNSTLQGAPATTPPCGFNLLEIGVDNLPSTWVLRLTTDSSPRLHSEPGPFRGFLSHQTTTA